MSAGRGVAPASVTSTRPADVCGRQAAARAFADLTDRVLALRMTEQTTVRRWIGSRTDVELALREAMYDLCQYAATPSAPDGCRVEVSVVIAEVARGWAQRLRRRSIVALGELEPIRQWSLRPDSARVSASAACRVPATAPASQPAVPIGWEHLPPEALALAERAAVADAADRLRARSRDLGLSATETVGDAFDLYAAFEDAFLREAERRIGREKAAFEPYGVCRIPAVVSLAELADLLSDAARRLPEPSPIRRVDFARIADLSQQGSISVEGVASPPPPGLLWPKRAASAEPPAWAAEKMTAVGHSGTEPAASRPTAGGLIPSAAVAEARLDAMRTMWSQVDELVLPGGRRVRDVVRANPELRRELVVLEEYVREAGASERDSEGNVTLRLTMPLAPLWDVLAPYARPPSP